jgi:hypothetical protein
VTQAVSPAFPELERLSPRAVKDRAGSGAAGQREDGRSRVGLPWYSTSMRTVVRSAGLAVIVSVPFVAPRWGETWSQLPPDVVAAANSEEPRSRALLTRGKLAHLKGDQV